ncbi:hypothetical protein ACX93W_20140 [Paenibacillus sp. CAU 1782]
MIDLEFPGNLVSWLLTSAAWIGISIVLIRHYRRQESKPVLWKALLAVIIGIPAFNAHIDMFGFTGKLAVLPIGVGLIYVVIKKESWQKYRMFAWAGFWSNYAMLAVALLTGMLFSAVYPTGELSTYLAHVDKARLVQTHPSAPSGQFTVEKLKVSIQEAVLQDNFPVLDWYHQSMLEGEVLYRKERFPFMLNGIEPQWGSGIHSSAFVEADGQGLLIVTGSDYLYFRSEEPFVWIGGEGQ